MSTLALLAAMIADPAASTIEVPAKLLSGTITSADYPRPALRRGAEGITRVRLVITPDGRASDCRLAQSSGHADLDAVVCPLATGRMRFSPALDRGGRPVPMDAILPVQWLVE